MRDSPLRANLQRLALCWLVFWPSAQGAFAQEDSLARPKPSLHPPVANVSSHGAVGDGVADDTEAIRSALTALKDGGVLYLPRGIYRISGEIEVSSDVDIACASATIRSDTPVRSYFHFSMVKRISVSGCTFDQNARNLPTYADENQRPANVALFFDRGSGAITVFDNVFSDLYTNALRLYHTNGDLYVANNRFLSERQAQMLLLDHIQIVTASGLMEIRNNFFLNAPVESAAVAPGCVFVSGTAGSVLIEANRFDFCGRDNTGHHRVGVVDFYGNSENVRVIGNTATNTMAQFMRLGSAWPAVIARNVIGRNVKAERGTTISVEATDFFVGLGRVGATDIDIHDNVLEAAGPENYGIAVTAYDYAIPSRNIKVVRNRLTNFRIAIGLCGPYEDVAIDHNTVEGSDQGGNIVVWKTSYGVVLTSRHGSTEGQSGYGRLSISDNIFRAPVFAASPIEIDFRKTPPFSGRIDKVVIARNTLQARADNKPAIAANTGVIPGKGHLSIKENHAQGFRELYRAAGFEEIVAIGNFLDEHEHR